MENLRGKRFGKLVALEPTDKRKNHFVVWKVKCDCGNIVEATSASLLHGHKKSCGCLAPRVIITYKGKEYSAKELSKLLGVDARVLLVRWHKGFRERDLLCPPRQHPTGRKFATYNGKAVDINELARLTGINRTTLYYRKKRGWSDEMLGAKVDEKWVEINANRPDVRLKYGCRK